MDATEIYPSGQWLKAEDIGDKKLKVQIEDIKKITIKEQDKLELSFQEMPDKTLVLNKTNVSRLVELYGKETDGWKGKVVELYTVMTNYQGSEVPAIRVRSPA